MKHFLFYVDKSSYVLGYDIYCLNKNIKNYKIESGFYLAFYEDDEKYRLEDDLINFLYNGRVLMIRKKTALNHAI